MPTSLRLLGLVLVAVFAAACSTEDATRPGPRESAVRAAAESTVRLAVAAANVHASEGDSYVGFDAAAAEQIEPSLNWLDGTEPQTGDDVSIVVASNDELLVVTRSEGEYVCGVGTFVSSETRIGAADSFTAVDTVEECTSAAA